MSTSRSRTPRTSTKAIVGRGREPRVPGAGVAAERRVDGVRRVEEQGVRPAAVAVGREDRRSASRRRRPAAMNWRRRRAVRPGRSAGRIRSRVAGREGARLLQRGVQSARSAATTGARPTACGERQRPPGPARRRAPRSTPGVASAAATVPGAAARRGRGAPRGRAPRRAATSRGRTPGRGRRRWSAVTASTAARTSPASRAREASSVMIVSVTSGPEPERLDRAGLGAHRRRPARRRRRGPSRAGRRPRPRTRARARPASGPRGP